MEQDANRALAAYKRCWKPNDKGHLKLDQATTFYFVSEFEEIILSALKDKAGIK